MQPLVDSIVTSSTVTICALALLMVSRSTGFLHFAHGAIFTGTAYAAVYFLRGVSISLWLAIPLALAVACALGAAMDYTIYRQLRYRQAAPLVGLLASIGMYIIIENCLCLIFGSGVHSIRTWPVGAGWRIGIGVITTTNAIAVLVALIVSVATGVWATKTRTGVQLRAVWNDSALSVVAGVNTERARMTGVILGSALAGTGGLLVAADTDIFPQMGLQPLMMALAAMILGRSRIPSTIAGAVVVGLAYHFGVICLPLQWQSLIVFTILLLVLLFRYYRFASIRSWRKVREYD